MKNKILSISLIAAFLSSGCAVLKTVSVTSIPAKRDQMVSTMTNRWTFLGIAFDNDFVDQLVEDLKSKCPDGMVTGILTKSEIVSYFLVFQEKVSAKGFCVKGAASAQSKDRFTNTTVAKGN